MWKCENIISMKGSWNWITKKQKQNKKILFTFLTIMKQSKKQKKFITRQLQVWNLRFKIITIIIIKTCRYHMMMMIIIIIIWQVCAWSRCHAICFKMNSHQNQKKKLSTHILIPFQFTIMANCSRSMISTFERIESEFCFFVCVKI